MKLHPCLSTTPKRSNFLYERGFLNNLDRLIATAEDCYYEGSKDEIGKRSKKNRCRELCLRLEPEKI